jgi:polyisoprenoid-binding protein YceI
VFSAGTRLNREDFDITWNVALETGGVLVSKEVSLDIALEAVLRPDDAPDVTR